MSEHELNQEPDIDPSSHNDASLEQTPGGRPKQDWLHTVARAAETVAPLVARKLGDAAGDQASAAAAFDRAVACDRTIAPTREMIEALVGGK